MGLTCRFSGFWLLSSIWVFKQNIENKKKLFMDFAKIHFFYCLMMFFFFWWHCWYEVMFWRLLGLISFVVENSSLRRTWESQAFLNFHFFSSLLHFVTL
jgi:hypothetical protein